MVHFRDLPLLKSTLMAALCAFVLETFAFDAIPVTASGVPEELLVRIEHGRLSIDAPRATLAQILEEIGDQSGVDIELHLKLDQEVSTAFQGLPLEKGIRRLLSGYNFVLLYGDRDEHARNRSLGANLRGVEVFSARATDTGRTSRGRRLRNFRNGSSGAIERGGFSPRDLRRLTRIASQALHSSDPTAREDAVDDLSFEDAEEYAAGILTEVLERDPDPDIRKSALDGLETLEAVPSGPVLEASVHDEEAEVRLRALEVIEFEEWTDERTIETLALALQDTAREVRLTAVEILGYLEQREVLESAARTSPDKEVRQRALDLLSDS